MLLITELLYKISLSPKKTERTELLTVQVATFGSILDYSDSSFAYVYFVCLDRYSYIRSLNTRRLRFQKNVSCHLRYPPLVRPSAGPEGQDSREGE